MKKRSMLHCIKYIGILYCGMCITLGYAQNPKYDELKKTQQDRFNGAIISIIGIVTDTENEKLKDVELKIEYSRPKNVWATESERIYDSFRVNGNFSIHKKYYTSASISFLKKGYYPENITFHTEMSPDKNGSALQTKLHVKLRKIGTLAKLIKINQRIEYDIKNKNQKICDLTKISDGILKAATFDLRHDISCEKYIHLDFERSQTGEIIYEKNNGRGIRVPAPKTYLLKFITPDPSDGFIFIDENIKNLNFLTDAPKQEYNIKILEIPYNVDKKYYFYIKCGDFYGKGCIKNIGVRNGRFDHKYNIFIEILFNRNVGDYNLRSL